MPISNAAINSLTLGTNVFDDLTYCMTEWQNAGLEAVQALSDPEEDSSTLTWTVTLIGNLAWAATAFFPPAFEVAMASKLSAATLIKADMAHLDWAATKVVFASASTATKAVSALGATLAADVVGKLRKLAGNLKSPSGKDFLKEYLGNQVPDLLKEYTAGAGPWVKKDLLNHMISQYSLRFHPSANDNNDAGFITFCNSLEGGEERRKYVWEDFVFPDFRTPFYNKPDDKGGKWLGGRSGLKGAIGKHLESAVKDFDQQWRKWKAGLDSATSDPRLYTIMKKDYLRRFPFNPVLKYSGVPEKLQLKQQSNQTKLSNLVRAND